MAKSKEFWEEFSRLNREEARDILTRNLNVQQTQQEENNSKKKAKTPWFAIGMAATRAKNAQRKLQKENRELKKALENINKNR